MSGFDLALACWQRLKRVFAIEKEKCEKCGGCDSLLDAEDLPLGPPFGGRYNIHQAQQQITGYYLFDSHTPLEL